MPSGEYDGVFCSDELSNRDEPAKITPITVSELTRLIKGVVDDAFPFTCVVGEVSSLSLPSSGHAYFSLKDATSQIDVAVWKNVLSHVGFKLKNGLKLICSGRIDVYVPHGKYKLIVTKIEPVGVGALELQFRQLEMKLRQEGLFDPRRKRPLPRFVSRIGVATSPTSAAMHDFLKTLATRTRRVDVVVASTKVQGEGAAREIADALAFFNANNARLKLDAIALIRGGGSMEDLWAFNEEVAARAVAESRIPVVTGIGHEIDVSLCDLAADVHALTPTGAAAAIAEEDARYVATIDDWSARMTRNLEQRVKVLRDRLTQCANRRIFQAPGEALAERRTTALDDLEKRLSIGLKLTMERREGAFKEILGKFEAMSPLAVLRRGYSITKSADGKVLRKSEDARPGDYLETMLGEGIVRSVVVE